MLIHVCTSQFYKTYLRICYRDQSQRIATLETARASPSTPSSLASDFQTPRSGLRKKQEFTSPETPDVEYLEGNDSFSSGGNSEMTPQMDKLSLGRGRGRPRKKLDYKIDMGDFPADGTAEEKDKYLKKKASEMWRLKKLSGEDAAEHRAKENARVKAYNQRKKAEKVATSTPSATQDDDEETEEKSVTKKKEQSRVR